MGGIYSHSERVHFPPLLKSHGTALLLGGGGGGGFSARVRDYIIKLVYTGKEKEGKRERKTEKCPEIPRISPSPERGDGR